MADVDPAVPLPVLGHRRSRAWTRVAFGIYRPAVVAGVVADAAAWQLAIPEDASFTGLTGALLRGWWTPPLPDDLPMFVAQATSSARSTRAGILVSRHKEAPSHDTLDGVRVAGPAEILLACGRDLCLLDMVLLVDGALEAGVPMADLQQAAGRRRRGAPRLRTALDWADPRAESPWEVVLRVFHRMCGVDVVSQHDVLDDAGTFLGRADLWLVGTRMLHEYDGAEHREKKGQQTDLRRGRRLGNSDWQRRGYTDGDLLYRAPGILRDIDLTLGRAHDPARIKPWHDMLRQSLFTAAGTNRLRLRWGLPGVPLEDPG